VILSASRKIVPGIKEILAFAGTGPTHGIARPSGPKGTGGASPHFQSAKAGFGLTSFVARLMPAPANDANTIIFFMANLPFLSSSTLVRSCTANRELHSPGYS